VEGHGGGVATGLDEFLDLLPGNEDLAEGFAACQLPDPQEPPDGLGAHVEGLCGLVDVVKQGLDLGSPDGFGGRQFDVFHFAFRCFFMAVIGHAAVIANLFSDSIAVPSDSPEVLSENFPKVNESQ
jgi:hypothetical protein